MKLQVRSVFEKVRLRIRGGQRRHVRRGQKRHRGVHLLERDELTGVERTRQRDQEVAGRNTGMTRRRINGACSA